MDKREPCLLYTSIIKELEELDITNITPMEALNKLDELQSKVRNRW